MAKPHGWPKGTFLRSRKEISAVFRHGRFHALGFLRAKTLPTQRETARFLISVRKAAGNAPRRNRIKRLLREAIRLHQAELQAPHDVCFFLGGQPPEGLGLSHVETEVRELFHRLSEPAEKAGTP